MSFPLLDIATATRFAEIALRHVTREYPHKADHVMDSEADVYTPGSVHPIFFGSFDWHSCVHGYWLLVRLLRLFPELPQAAAIRELFRKQFVGEKVQAECNYLARPSSRSFEQPYGWAWFLMLAAELRRSGTSETYGWLEVLSPLQAAFLERLKAYLLRLTYPIRAGAHTNTAFALVLAAEYAEIFEDLVLRKLLMERAVNWFGSDKNAQAWEPSGDDFLSPTLQEAEAMRKLVAAESFLSWFRNCLPEVTSGKPESLFAPAHVSDREDGKIGHLDGLNLSRAWCFHHLASALPDGCEEQIVMMRAAHAHYNAASAHLTANYMSEHWLASFALLALTG